jgi:hypothetical protein
MCGRIVQGFVTHTYAQNPLLTNWSLLDPLSSKVFVFHCVQGFLGVCVQGLDQSDD